MSTGDAAVDSTLGRTTKAAPDLSTRQTASLFGPFGQGGLGSVRPSEFAHALACGFKARRYVPAGDLPLYDPEFVVQPDQNRDGIVRTNVNRLHLLYDEVAAGTGTEALFRSGRDLASTLGYPDSLIDRVPDVVVDRFVGLANLYRLSTPGPGERILDVGCGAGFDLAVAATLVGPTGSCLGVDRTPSMARIARSALRDAGLHWASVVVANAQNLPLPDGSVDAVHANGLVAHFPEPGDILREFRRVLTDGGTLRIADHAYPGNRGHRASDLDRWNANRLSTRLLDGFVDEIRSAGFCDIRHSDPFIPFRSEAISGGVRSYTFEASADSFPDRAC